MPSVEKGKRPKIKGLLDHLFHSKMGWFLVISSHPPLEREAVYPNPWRFWYWVVSFYFTVIAWTPTRKMTIFNRLFIKKVLWLTMRCPEERCGLRGTFTPELRSCLLLAPDALLLEHREAQQLPPPTSVCTLFCPAGVHVLFTTPSWQSHWHSLKMFVL